MGIRHPRFGVFSKDLLCVVLVLACGCSLFKRKDDEGTGGAPGAVAVAQPPVFNVNAPEGTGGTTAVAEPAPRKATTSHAGASGKVPAGAASVAATPSAAAPTASATTTAATPSGTTAALPVVSQACITACTGTFSTCVQGGQLPACQQGLKDCMAICNKKP
jgi:hypothetical protein